MGKFYLGADIGTNSVGIACTDENYDLLRAKGHDCWSVRLFEDAKTAVERRGFRSARRRLARRRQRVLWLQSLFSEFIDDDTFFIRLNNSQYLSEDKDELLGQDTNNLFNDADYNDKSFHKEFPTIYHLRKSLMSDKKYDLRLYYLALHHIVKYRGHFLFEGDAGKIRDERKLFENLNAVLADNGFENLFSDVNLGKDVKDILLSNRYGVKEKQTRIEKLFGVTSENKFSKEIIKGFCGAKISPSALFGEEYKSETGFSFKKLENENFEAMRGVYGDNFIVLESIRSIYNFVTFEKILSGYDDISSAMVAIYEKHAEDLKMLKNYIRSNYPEDYNVIFKSTDEKYNYVNYIGYTKKGGDKKKVAKCKDEEFYSYLQKYFKDKNDEVALKIKDKIAKEEFLPKILHADNGLFPMQVNEYELKKIVERMKENYPETVGMADKILPLFRYRIPYYVGPLTGKNSWTVRSNEKITPWNFDEVVDKAKSNEAFMRKMTNKCSYLRAEDVLPKASVFYQTFDVLNQINKLRINDVPVSVSLKQKIFTELFLKYAKVSDKAIKDLIVREGLAAKCENITLSGKDGDFKASMSTYVKLKEILGDFVDADLTENGKICENIVLWHTLNTDKNIVEDLILRNYGKIPQVKENIKRLKGLTFKDFGRLSEKLLVGLKGVNKTTGELTSILGEMYNTNNNFNELMNDEDYNFGELINAENGVPSEEVTYEDVDELRVSPAVKRGVWQTLVLIDEYVAAIGKVPDKIFVEVSRENGKKGEEGRIPSRKKALTEKFETLRGAGYDDVIAELGEEKYSDMRLRQERLFLYFRQLGRCMYTGKRIDLEQLNTDLYDVDHILPRTYIKDDSLDNKVLVLRSKNAEKSDTYPLPAGFSDQKDFWKLLLEKKLISKTTYDRLTRVEPLGEDDYRDFINRQKVITDQSAKAVIELLQRKYPATKIVFSKAKNVHDFKRKFNLYKCRETNDLHHARDAYLNIVVGNVYSVVFPTQWSEFYMKDGGWRTFNLKKLFTCNVKGAWDENSIAKVKANYFKSSPNVTRYAYCYQGEFYNQTVYGKNNKGITAPRKLNSPLANVSKYGGYMAQKTAYFAIVSSLDKKGKRVKSIEAIPVLTAYRLKNGQITLEDYFGSYLREPEIIIPKLKSKQLITYNGTPAYIAGVTGPTILLHNAVELFTNNRTDEYVNGLLTLLDIRSKTSIEERDKYPIKTNRNGDEKLVIDADKNEELYRYLKDKLSLKAYSGIPAFKTFKNNLEKGFDKFKTLSIVQQASVLVQILRFFKCNAETSDLSLLGYGKRVGTLAINQNIDKAEVKIICKSPAGLKTVERKV